MDFNVQSIRWLWPVTREKLMKISIEYCMEWNYEPRALSLRDDLVDEFSTMFDQFNVQLIESGGGVFEVMVNDVLEVFSKRRIGRFPNSSYEIIKTINDAIDERRLG